MDILPHLEMKKPKKYVQAEPEPFEVRDAAVAYGLRHEPISASSILGIEVSDIDEPLRRVNFFRKGLSKESFDKLKKVTGLDYNSLAMALSVSTKTLQRKDVFDVVQSEKMYELAELYAMGMAYFGEEGFRRWMERPLFSIGNIKPLDIIDVSEGTSLLKDEIGRLQHGIAV